MGGEGTSGHTLHLHNLETQQMASNIPALCTPASIVSQLNKMGNGMGGGRGKTNTLPIFQFGPALPHPPFLGKGQRALGRERHLAGLI